jgi:hypothetical protein
VQDRSRPRPHTIRAGRTDALHAHPRSSALLRKPGLQIPCVNRSHPSPEGQPACPTNAPATDLL